MVELGDCWLEIVIVMSILELDRREGRKKGEESEEWDCK